MKEERVGKERRDRRGGRRERKEEGKRVGRERGEGGRTRDKYAIYIKKNNKR